ncbi:putative glycosyltransferase 3 [Hordeum vulgare]|nr:putative glycosyltransferase 3 [Hordeum vulgare]
MAAGGLGRPGRPARGGNKQMQKTINNVKITLICGFITILVLRGTVGINLIAFSGDGGGDAAADAKVAEDIERILREIRSDSDPDEGDQPVDASSGNSTTMPVVEEKNYTLGPSITRWNAKRRQWLSQNPGFPSRDARGNPRILLVTGSSPGPCDNPAGDHYLLKSTKTRSTTAAFTASRSCTTWCTSTASSPGTGPSCLCCPPHAVAPGGGVGVVDGQRRALHRHGLRGPALPLRGEQPRHPRLP